MATQKPGKRDMIDFAELLTRSEGDTLDFKATSFDLSNPDSTAAMVKDIVCMANTPRDSESYIVTGVKKYADGNYDLVGVSCHPDDADLQSAFADRVYPHPRFGYEIVTHRGLQFGLFRIPPVRLGPCVAVKDFGQLRQWQIYFRRSSRNSVANPADQRAVYAWFEKSSSPPRAAYDTDTPGWQRVLEATHSSSTQYPYWALRRRPV